MSVFGGAVCRLFLELACEVRGTVIMTRRNPFRNVLMISVTLAVVGCEQSTQTETAAPVLEAPVAGVPMFRVDPDWPQVPAQWKLGDVSSIAIDAQDNAWLLHRPRVLPPDEIEMAAPAVLAGC